MQENEGMKGKGGNVVLTVKEACTKLPRKGEQNKEKNPGNPTLPLVP